MKDVLNKLWKRGSLIVFSLVVFIFLLLDKLIWVNDMGKCNMNWWFGLIYGMIPLCCLVLAPLFLLGSRAKWFYVIFFFVEIVLQVVGWFARINFGMMLDGDLVGIVLASSPEEVMWFVKHFMTVSSFALLFLFGFLLVGFYKLIVWACRSSVTRTTVVMGCGAILLFVYANRFLDVFAKKNYRGLEQQIFGVNLIIESFRRWSEFKHLAAMKASPCIPKTIKLSIGQTNDVIGVVILGESATRSHWGLYGYGRNTTPCMSARKEELIVFDDLVTPVGITAESMHYVFTTRTIENRNDLRFTMAQCLRAVGYDVAMFSNQNRWGEREGGESFDFAGCDPFLFMKGQGETNTYDEVLLPYYIDYLSSVKRKSVVFLHLNGSHVPVSDRYPKDGAPFEAGVFLRSRDEKNPALSKNHYDNSIWYTDKILERVICELEAKHMPTWMIYFPDHGETPASDSWRAQADNDLWEIPFIAWTSKEFNEKFPGKVSALKRATKLALQSDQLMYGILSFCGIEGLGNKPEEDFLNPSFRCREKRKVQNGRVDYVPRKCEQADDSVGIRK